MAGERRTGRLAVLPAVALAALFAAGLAHLFQLRFGAGDVYPPYSSLRADPLGAKAFHDSLVEAGLPVRRSYRPVPGSPGTGTTMLLLGVSQTQVARTPRALADALEAAATAGARVVFCLRAAPPPPRRGTSEAGEPPASEGGGEEAEEASPGREEPAPRTNPPDSLPEPWSAAARPVSLGERWGFSLETAPLSGLATGAIQAVRAPGVDGLPGELPWHSALSLGNLGEGWRVLYAVEGRPVVAERTLGAGTLVLASDAYLVSNEALWRERHPALLAWLVGAGTSVIFDEAHLGVAEAPGVAALARRLGLQGALPALLALFLLFAWKRASPLGGAAAPTPGAPGPSGGAAGGDGAERDAAAGLENLLRRSVPPGQLLAACVREWERVGAPRGPAGEPVRRRFRDTLAAAAGQNPVETYRRLCRALTRRRGFDPEATTPPPSRGHR